MSERRKSGLSISFRIDEGVVEHNNREFIAKNVDRARIPDNVTYRSDNIRDFYNELFGQALSEYNAKKKHPYQRIPDYYEHIRKGKQEKLFNEIVVQFGDMKDCGVGSDNWETAKQMLDEYMREFEKRNPNLKVFNAVMHLDEATPHIHIDFVPIAHSVNRGLSTRVSMKGALREQGFSSSNRIENEYTAWSESERAYMEQILRKYGLYREDKNVHREHLSVDDYKQQIKRQEELKKLNEHITELKKKSDSSYTPEEITAIKNQNDYLRAEIVKKKELIATLSQQINAPFIFYEILSEEKLQYIADGLTRAKIPFVEDTNGLHIPDYALKTANVISSHFKPTATGTIREQIALDIDRLIFSSADLEELLAKLKEKGYEIKRGKHLAVKAPFSERFIRLKSLGKDYLQSELEHRISEREEFPRSVRREMANHNAMGKKVCVTILETTTAIQQFRIIPRKIYPQKVYGYRNDERIKFLTMQLKSIQEFGVSSYDDVTAKSTELKESIERRNAEIKAMEDEVPTLKYDISQIRYYFSNLQNRRKLDTMGQVKFAAAKETAEKYGISSEQDIAKLEERLRLLPTYISAERGKVASEQEQLKRITQLGDVYEKIINGNYIDNLIKEQREQEQKIHKK